MYKELSLYQLNNLVSKVLKQTFPKTIRLVAEISEMNINRTGHCYLSLVEKEEGSDKIKAQARATIWASTFRMLKPYFEKTTGRAFTKGLKVLLGVEVVFHENYGYSLNVRDIDPTYTLGDIERLRREILDRLKKEGISELNKLKKIPLLPKTIAIISSSTAAGYGDFIEHLQNNPKGYKFSTKLFPTIMQGDEAVGSIVSTLQKIAEYDGLFDIIVIIRGGGSRIDLSCFDSYELAYEMLQSPFPIIAGIGHERDVTIADSISHTRVKTPTAAATFIIDQLLIADEDLKSLSIAFKTGLINNVNKLNEEMKKISSQFGPEVSALLNQENLKCSFLNNRFKELASAFLKEKEYLLSNHLDNVGKLCSYKLESRNIESINYSREFKLLIKNKIDKENRQLENMQTIVSLSDPLNILKKGYSLSYNNGKLIKDLQDIKSGDVVETILADGKFVSEVKNISKKNGTKEI